jgi:ribosomal protein L16 Arg81 hydroxylase
MHCELMATKAEPQADVLPMTDRTTILIEAVEDMRTMMKELINRYAQLEKRFNLSVEKESYTVEQAGERLNRKPWTVRQWCNKGQVKGAYKVHGKGRTGEWRIPHEELVRLQNEGPLPEGKHQAA